MDECGYAAFDLTIEVTGLFMALIGLPSGIGKKAARAIARKAGRNLQREVVRIAKEHFQDASDLLSIANGILEFFELLLKYLSPDKIISTIIGEMAWYEVPVY